MATDGEMKVLVVVFTLATTATMLAYGGETAGVPSVLPSAARPAEPGVLLLAGGVLLAAAGLVKRFTGLSGG